MSLVVGSPVLFGAHIVDNALKVVHGPTELATTIFAVFRLPETDRDAGVEG